MVVEIELEATGIEIDGLVEATSSRAARYLDGIDSDSHETVRAVHAASAAKVVGRAFQGDKQLEPTAVENLISHLVNRSMGLGLIGKLDALVGQGISDLFVKGSNAVVVHYRDGTRKTFTSWVTTEEQLRDEVSILRSRTGSVSPFDINNPHFDTLTDAGVRINGTYCAGGSIELSCRYPDPEIVELEDLTQLDFISSKTAAFLGAALRAKLNIVISGPTGSGKTTLLRCLLSGLDDLTRVVTIEDSSELDLGRSMPALDIVELVVSPPNSDGAGGVSSRELFANALRLSPDRIIVGEARDEIARELLTSMSSGNTGSISTIHARSPRAVVDRLIEYSQLSYQLVAESVRNGVDLFIHTDVFENDRWLSHISEVSQNREADGLLRLRPIFECGTPELAHRCSPNPSSALNARLREFGWR